MSATSLLLEIPEVRSRVSPVTVAQYHQFPEFNENGRRTELIRGLVVEKMSKSPLHSSIATRLYLQLVAILPIGWIARKEEPLTLLDSEPEPDIAIICGNEHGFFNNHPATADLVIEIAVTSANEDRALAALYAEAGVKEYWIVLPAERRIEVYRNPEANVYFNRLFAEGDSTLACNSIPEICIQLAELFR